MTEAALRRRLAAAEQEIDCLSDCLLVALDIIGDEPGGWLLHDYWVRVGKLARKARWAIRT